MTYRMRFWHRWWFCFRFFYTRAIKPETTKQ